jgi:hypothetical protein
MFEPPPPVPLRRESTMCLDQSRTPQPTPQPTPPPSPVDEETTTRYLQFDCTLHSCKYKDPCPSWGELILKDYPHFIELMAFYLPLESKTYQALLSQVGPESIQFTNTATRFYDTPQYTQQQQERYLDFKCSHKGKHNKKTWRQVRADSYGYFKWAVKNTMGRDTKTFQYLLMCLKPEDQVAVAQSQRSPMPQPVAPTTTKV